MHCPSSTLHSAPFQPSRQAQRPFSYTPLPLHSTGHESAPGHTPVRNMYHNPHSQRHPHAHAFVYMHTCRCTHCIHTYSHRHIHSQNTHTHTKHTKKDTGTNIHILTAFSHTITYVLTHAGTYTHPHAHTLMHTLTCTHTHTGLQYITTESTVSGCDVSRATLSYLN